FHLTPGVAIEDMTFEGTLTSDWGHNNSKPVSSPPIGLLDALSKIKTQHGAVSYDPRTHSIAGRDTSIAVEQLRSVMANLAVLGPGPRPAMPRSAAVRWFSASSKSATSSTVAKVLYKNPGVMLIPASSLPAGFDPAHVTLQREGRTLAALAVIPAGVIVYAP